MTNAYLRFTPLYGVKSNDPYCYLLNIGTATVLLDCGLNDSFDVALLEPLIKLLPQVDLVLLSHPDPSHIGALPYLVRKAGLKAPIYAAVPIAKLGMMFMYDSYTSLHAEHEFDLFNAEDIDTAFESIKTLKHHQQVSLDLRGQQLKVVGYPAGHLVGGTIWVLESGGEVVVYGVNANHNKERLLNPGELHLVPKRTALLITDAARANAPEVKRVNRDKDFEAAILSVLRGRGDSRDPPGPPQQQQQIKRESAADSTSYGGQWRGSAADSAGYTGWGRDSAADSGAYGGRLYGGDRRESDRDRDRGSSKEQEMTNSSSRTGNVLLPVDTAGRMLEVLLVLDRIWQNQSKTRLPYEIVLLSCVATSTLTAARGLLEYMSSDLQNEFNITYNHPLNMKNLRLAHSVADVMNSPKGDAPKVVLATGLSMDYGMARQLLLQWGSNPQNAVIFTQEPKPGTFAAELLNFGPKPGQPGVWLFNITVSKRVLLEGQELEAFEAARLAAEAEAAAAGAQEEAAAAALPLRESSAVNMQLKRNEAGTLEQVLAVETASNMFEDTNMVDEDVLMDGFRPPKTAMYCMFPDEQEAVTAKWDDWGAVVDLSSLRTVEDIDDSIAAAEDDEPDTDLRPTKLVTEHVTLSLQAPVMFIDGFSGCSDGGSLRKILGMLAPRALALVGASAGLTADMAAKLAREVRTYQTKVYAPGAGEQLSFPMAPSYPIAISSQLFHALTTHKLPAGGDSYEVAWIAGQLARVEDAAAAAAAAENGDGAGSSAQAEEQRQQQFAVDEQPSFVLQPPGTVTVEQPLGSAAAAAATAESAAAAAGGEPMEVDAQIGAAAAEGPAAAAGADAAGLDASDQEAAACGDHGGIFIGNVLISEVKQALARAGFVAEFRGPGRLLVAGSLIVERDGPEGQLVLEGPLCEDYFKVRDVVYGQYNVC